MYTRLFLILFLFLCGSLFPQETEVRYLSGIDADSPVEWEFQVSKGRKSNIWTKIPVPSNWELHGFGEYNYGHDKNKSDEIGHYKHSFFAPNSWRNKIILIVFEGVMTDTEVKINGIKAGDTHQGGFYRFNYDITNLLKFNSENHLEVQVKKVSDNESVEIAERKSDYWVFGGIYRPVYLKILPFEYIERTAINAKADGSFTVDLHLKNITDSNIIEAAIFDKSGRSLSAKISEEIKSNQNLITLKTKVSQHKNWTAENPELYYLDVSLKRDGQVMHTIRERFGFRTIEVREGKGIFLNDTIITLKGCNRHSFYPTTGRALSRNRCYEDVMLIKEMNMNAVRMSHYPPDTYFLDLCDEYGIYVLDEVAGWQKPPYDTPTSKRLIRQTVIRDVNHPSILFWDNGNEGGWNTDTDEEFHKYDPQKRRVLHPWEFFGGIDTDHYENYESVKSKMNSGNIFMPTEHLHGLYDGGIGAGLDDFWKLMWGNSLNGGMFLWVFADEGIIRTDKDWIIDTDGNHAPDGILGPFHQKEGSFYTIKEVWSPVYIDMDKPLDIVEGVIPVENRYDFTNLMDCYFKWELISYPLPGNPIDSRIELASGVFRGPDIEPRNVGALKLNMPALRDNSDALHLTGYDMNNKEIFTWKWKLTKNIELVDRIIINSNVKLDIEQDSTKINISSNSNLYVFSKNNGMIERVKNGESDIPFVNGPLFVADVADDLSAGELNFNIMQTDTSAVLNFWDHPHFDKLSWTVINNGWLKLEYEYSLRDSVDYMGISFNYPEERVLSIKWLGKGPYRVWKNRMKGPTYDIWEKQYKNFARNTNWDYPEFAGYYDDFSWAVLNTLDGYITLLTESEDLILRVYSQLDGDEPRNTRMIWPEGDISFLHAIPAIGTKFHKAESLGPNSRKFSADGKYEGTLYFYFGLPNSL